MDRDYSRPGRATTQEPLHGKAGRQFAGTPQTRSIARPVAALPPAFENQNRRRAFKCMQTIVSGAAIIALLHRSREQDHVGQSASAYRPYKIARNISRACETKGPRRAGCGRNRAGCADDCCRKNPSQTFEKAFSNGRSACCATRSAITTSSASGAIAPPRKSPRISQRTLRSDLPDPLAMSTEAELRGKIQRSWRQLAANAGGCCGCCMPATPGRNLRRISPVPFQGGQHENLPLPELPAPAAPPRGVLAMTCRDTRIKRLLPLYEAGLLNPEEAGQVESHLWRAPTAPKRLSPCSR